MGEIKSVKVDNWGVFFLQKLQNFFNKTDFCDLTLQFKDNSQLKVHRLVLSACTDFFNVLEQTCELTDDALIMPPELQADVVVPIVNFMYTGTLEFELRMYNRLLNTAKEMNMTVLLKLLEAHKRTMETSRTNINKGTGLGPKNKRIPHTQTLKANIQPPQTLNSTQQPQRRVAMNTNLGTPTRRGIMRPMQDRNTYKPGSNTQTRAPPQLQRGPTRFEDPNTKVETYESSFDSISYESKPMKEEPEEYMEMQVTQRKRSSPFEQLRKGFNNNKRPAVATFTSPPAKKPNIEDVKEFSEQQRMRKQIAAEFGDDAEFEGVMDDEYHHDDDDEETTHLNPTPSSSSNAVKQQQQQQNQQASIVIKQSPNEKPTIVVKDSSNSKMDHAKIISEVLRQYPHLVKSNKNIKLKIMPNVGGQTQKIIVKKETLDNMSAEMEQGNEAGKTQSRQQMLPQNQHAKQMKLTPSTYGKSENQRPPSASVAPKNTNTTSGAPTKRRIDSKTMHALIAQGAENTTGPWLCLRCGVNGRPISIPSYRGFRRHLINTHKETIDAALCEYCGWRSKNNRALHYHMFIEHKVATLLYTFPECTECNKICLSEGDLQVHGEQFHPDSHKQECIYCNKVFVKEMHLYNHMKTFHKRRAHQDGVIDLFDEEMGELNANEDHSTKETGTDSKIKILSDIALPSTVLKLEEQPLAIEEEYANDSGPKFVNAEGNEMLLTAEQREEIMSQLDQDHDGGVVMVLNENTFPTDEVTEEIPNDVKMKFETSDTTDDYDDHNTEFLSGGEEVYRRNDNSREEMPNDSNKDDEDEAHEQHESDHEERMDDEDRMEWAENLISAHDADEEVEEDDVNDDKDTEDETVDAEKTKEKDKALPAKLATQKNEDPKKEEDIHQKLKMLTGDWTDDEIDEDEDEHNVDSNDQEHKETSEKVQPSAPGAENEPEHEKSEDDATKLLEEAGDDFENEHETDIEHEGSIIGEDEVTQFSQPEKVEELDETLREDGKIGMTKEPVKSEEVAAKTLASEETIQENKEKLTAKVKLDSGRTSRRTSAAKDDETKKTNMEDPPQLKVESPLPIKKGEDGDDAAVENEKDVDEEKDSKSKTDIDIEKGAVTSSKSKTKSKSTEEDSVKTPDKVKSLISEWADEDEDL